MSHLNQENISLAEENNRLILDASFGRLFPVNADPKVQTVHSILDQLRRTNEASVSLTALIGRMNDAPREGEPQSFA